MRSQINLICAAADPRLTRSFGEIGRVRARPRPRRDRSCSGGEQRVLISVFGTRSAVQRRPQLGALGVGKGGRPRPAPAV